MEQFENAGGEIIRLSFSILEADRMNGTDTMKA